jgi:hypothetical protein
LGLKKVVFAPFKWVFFSFSFNVCGLDFRALNNHTLRLKIYKVGNAQRFPLLVRTIVLVLSCSQRITLPE